MNILDGLGIIPIDPNANKYIYDNHYVPRVNDILSAMLHEKYLMGWANSIGLYKRQKYEDVLAEAGDKGTYVHDAIDEYLKNGTLLDYESVPYRYQKEVKNAFVAFLNWWKIITDHNNVKIIMNEGQLVCPYFGGTLDLLVSINNRVYLLDFKTSNRPSYKYHLQLAAYMYMLREIKGIKIDGCGILMLSKKHMGLFDEKIMDFETNPNSELYMNSCEDEFLSLVYSYYGRITIERFYGRVK